MKEVVQKVERVLSSLKCGYKFEKKERFMKVFGKDILEVAFVAPSSSPVEFCGLSFNIGLCVSVTPSQDGGASVEYQCAEYFGAAYNPRDVIEDVLGCRSREIMSYESAGRAYDGILDTLYEVYEGMLSRFSEEFEEALPDVYIVDRCYRPNPGEVPVRVRMVVGGHKHPEAV